MIGDGQTRCAYTLDIRWPDRSAESLRGCLRPATLSSTLRQTAAIIRARQHRTDTSPVQPGPHSGSPA
ncbi:hypothetical protein [Nocardia sp. alder85J]|uniref:hypothetical protein n=1 Tax=Nocardia sp. alder85J TaxID=2862949 RepID=UPI001CD56215|nr:hypothetical protein [Nocardia sp. alder85J]MCX4097727.1 hypothetical protein [Nocardia sp. alder85J]